MVSLAVRLTLTVLASASLAMALAQAASATTPPAISAARKVLFIVCSFYESVFVVPLRAGSGAAMANCSEVLHHLGDLLVREDGAPGRHQHRFIAREAAELARLEQLFVRCVAHAFAVGVVARSHRKAGKVDAGAVALEAVALRAIDIVDLLDRRIGAADVRCEKQDSCCKRRREDEIFPWLPGGSRMVFERAHFLSPRPWTDRYAVIRWIS